MADLHFDKGTLKEIETPFGKGYVESQGFVIIGRVDTQDQARAAKKAVRALGPEFREIDYDVAPVKPVNLDVALEDIATLDDLQQS